MQNTDYAKGVIFDILSSVQAKESDAMSNTARSILEKIGNSPLIEISDRLNKGAARVLAKVEYFNPGGSVKDRVAAAMIDAAEKSGRLKPGATIIEPTSGNTGVGLALVSAVRGYRLILTMPETMSVERQKLLKALGAEVLPFAFKTECCGAAMGIPDVNIPGSLSGRILEAAKAAGAEAVVTACPLCHMNLDLRQRQAARVTKNKPFELPVFYYTQLIALAFGLPEESIRLDKLAVNPKPLLDKIAARREARVQASLAEARKAAGVAS